MIVNFKNKKNLLDTVEFKINSNDKNILNSKNLSLYKYDTTTDSLKLVKENIKVNNGYITLELDSLDEYVLSDVKINSIEETDTQSSSNKGIIIISIVVGILVLVVITIIVSKKKKNK